jgi:SET and MYND domain-containing protein
MSRVAWSGTSSVKLRTAYRSIGILRVYKNMSSPQWLPPTLRLASDPVARSKCLATACIKAGSQIFTEESFATILLSEETGKRCDACFRLPSSKDNNHLKKCSGCGSYWYCDAQCKSVDVVSCNSRLIACISFFSIVRSKSALGIKPQADLSGSQLFCGFGTLSSPPRT